MDIKASSIRAWSRLGQKGAFFGIALPELVANNERLKLVTADLAMMSGMDRFKTNFPDQFINVGIAEQNMVGISAGLAMEGDTVFATTYASFIAVRSLEHVRQHLSHLQCNVKIVGTSAGVVAAKSGVSHWATEDLAFTRVLPGIEVFSAADALEAIKIAEYAASNDKPMYIRLSGSLNCPVVYKEDYEFKPGKLVELKKGNKSKCKIAIIATGLMVFECLKAAESLEQENISCSVYNMHTIKPIDKAGLKAIFSENDMIVTVEEHNILGGMGSAVAEFKSQMSYAPKQVFIGFEDSFAEAGSQRYVWQQVGLTEEGIADRIKNEWSDNR